MRFTKTGPQNVFTMTNYKNIIQFSGRIIPSSKRKLLIITVFIGIFHPKLDEKGKERRTIHATVNL